MNLIFDFIFRLIRELVWIAFIGSILLIGSAAMLAVAYYVSLSPSI